MTNKLRRSMTSVLLAASLLFSSQSVVAFADYGSKSDASDLSPVQESVENATEEQQEDPSLSVEPVIGESTEAPVAAPMMARANAPVAYSAPTPKPGYEELTAYTALAKDCQLHVYINSASAGNIDLIDSNALDEVFPEGTGFRVFESKPNSEWVFDKWETNVFLDGTIYNINESNPTGVATGVYCFSDPSNKNTPYNSESNSIRVNRVTGLCEDRWHNIYYSVYANFNPLVTVNVGENGTVTYNNTEVSHKDSGKKVEVEYGTAPGFTIDPVDGYKVASVTFGDDIITADEDGTYFLPPVTEPTTLEVTFEPDIESNKPNPGVNMDEVILTVKCATCGKIYQYNLTLKGTEGIDGDYYIDYVSGQNKAKISINNQKWLNKFDSTGNHILNDEPYSVLELSLNDDDKWTIDNNEDSEKTTIHVKCTSEILGPDESIISQLEVALNCVNVIDGSHNDTSKLSTYTTGYYTCEVDKVNRTATVSITEDQAKYWIDNNINTMVGKEQHSFVSVSDPITLTYENGQWKVPADSKFTINMLCAPTDKEIETALDGKVNVICDTQPQKHAAKSYGVDFDGAYTRPEVMKENTYVVTINHNVYPAKYDSDFLTYPAPKHTLIEGNPPESLAIFVWNSSENKWELQEDKDTLAEIHVQCEIPSLDADDLAPLKVYLECVGNPDHNDGPIGNLGYLDPTTYYTVTVNTETKTATVEIKPTQSENWVNNSNVVGKPQHILYMPSNEKATFTYTNGKWELDKNSTDSFHIKMFCGPTDKDLQDATVIVDCINANVNHQSFPFALISGTYEFGDVYSIENTYFCDVTVHSNQYVAAYNDKHYPNHNTSEDQAFILKFEDGAWKLQEKNITFKVSCDAPAKPTNPDIEAKVDVTVHCLDNTAHHDITSDLKAGTYSVGEVVTSSDGQYICTITVNSNQYVANYNATYAKHSAVPSELVTMKYDGTNWNVVYGQSPAVFKVSCGTKPTDPTDPTDPNPNPGGNGGDNDDDDDRYTGGNTVTRTINDDDVPLNDRPTNTTTIDDEDVPLADLPDDTVTIDDGEVPLKANPSTGDSLPFAAMAAAALSLGGVIVLNRKKK